MVFLIAERLYGVSEWQALSGGTPRDSEETFDRSESEGSERTGGQSIDCVKYPANQSNEQPSYVVTLEGASTGYKSRRDRHFNRRRRQLHQTVFVPRRSLTSKSTMVDRGDMEAHTERVRSFTQG